VCMIQRPQHTYDEVEFDIDSESLLNASGSESQKDAYIHISKVPASLAVNW